MFLSVLHPTAGNIRCLSFHSACCCSSSDVMGVMGVGTSLLLLLLPLLEFASPRKRTSRLVCDTKGWALGLHECCCCCYCDKCFFSSLTARRRLWLLADDRFPKRGHDEEVCEGEERLGDAVEVVNVGEDLVVLRLGCLLLLLQHHATGRHAINTSKQQVAQKRKLTGARVS